MKKSYSRSKERNNAMICIYQGLCVGKPLESAVEDEFRTPFDQCSPYIQQVINDVNENFEKYESIINSRLKGYTFQRLGYVEQAILLLAFAEINQHIADKAIIINEAVELSKRYCDEQAHKLINGVLDRE